MPQKTVGVRELKARLSGYIQEVKKGHTIVVTERGRPVVRMTAVEASLEEKVQNLIRSGTMAWSGKKLKAGRPLAKLRRGGKTVGQIVIENRD